jgi:tetratricopeptide (TPR) repeat protein
VPELATRWPPRRPWGWYGAGAAALLVAAWLLRPQPAVDKKAALSMESVQPRPGVVDRSPKAAAPPAAAVAPNRAAAPAPIAAPPPSPAVPKTAAESKAGEPVAPAAAAAPKAIEPPAPPPVAVAPKAVEPPAPPPAAAEPKAVEPAPAVASTAPAPASDALYSKALERGQELLRRRKYLQAASHFQRAVKEKPQAVPGLLALGDAYLEADKPRSALQPLESAAHLDAKSGRAQLLLGTAYQSLGRNAQAREAYRRYLELEPQGEFARDVRLILANLAH